MILIQKRDDARPLRDVDRSQGRPTTAGYMVQRRVVAWTLAAIDRVCALLASARGRPPAPRTPPRRILVANGAHLGDVVLATAVLPALRLQFPDAEIGMLVGSWSREIVATHPDIAHVHIVDHWKLQRGRSSRLQKFLHHHRTQRTALREIRALAYELAIDLYFFFPNSSALLWRAGIPVRIGYSSGGFGPLYSHALEWTSRDQSVVDYHAALLAAAGVASAHLAAMHPTLVRAPLPPQVSRRVGNNPYVVMHMGAGKAIKEWPLANWRELLRHCLSSSSLHVVLTGVGPKEKIQADQLAAGQPRCHVLVDDLAWHEFTGTLAAARAVVGVDSTAVHVAAAFDVPTVVIGNGLKNIYQWAPPTPGAIFVVAGVPCMPCYRTHGCATMDCVRDITASTVMQALDTAAPEA